MMQQKESEARTHCSDHGGIDFELESDERALPELVVEINQAAFKQFKNKSFHLDTYCFDSKPEMRFFDIILRSDDVRKVYFTGMLTHGQSDFYIHYIDPEVSGVRTYYPDFLIEKKDGSYVIVEIKGEHKLDDPVVESKKKFAEQMATDNRGKRTRKRLTYFLPDLSS